MPPEEQGKPEPESFFRRRGEEKRPQPAPGLSASKVVGDFRLISLIGQGGMGQVWEAEQVSLRRTVAVKFVRPERVTEKQLELFAREARAGGRLAHPGIVTVYGYGQSDGLAWIAMEFVSGAWTLKDFLDEPARAEEVPEGYDRHVARLVAEIAEAMQTAHEAGVIHRDLKPQNVLITGEDRPKVTDFGLARITDESAMSQTGDFAGTYFYMSPEQVAARRAGIDHRTDVFSLGIVLYELLALRRPFEGDTSHQVAAQILAKDPPEIRTIRSRVPRDLAVIAGKALEKDRDKRFQTMKEFAADLRRHLGNEPIHATPPTRIDRAVKWMKRNPGKSSAAAIVAVTFTVIALLLVANVRTNRALAGKTTEAEASARRANEKAAEAERLRQEAVVREEAATARADALWAIEELKNFHTIDDDLEYAHSQDRPSHLWWLEEAHELVDGRPADPARNLQRKSGLEGHRSFLERIRREARESTEAERAADRASHSKAKDLEMKRAELLWISRVLRLEPWPLDSSPEWGSDQENASTDALVWCMRVWELLGDVNVDSRVYGVEVEALKLARRAVDLATDENRSFVRATLASALISSGSIDEALAELRALYEMDTQWCLKHEGYLSSLASRARSLQEGAAVDRREALLAEVAALDKLVGEWRTFRFDDSEKEWWNTHLSELLRDLEGLRDTIALAERSVRSPEAKAKWDEAIDAIARSEKYGGLLLTPQLELLPIGPDTDSGLWEFVHLATGEPAVRGGDGKVILKTETGIVFVLLPSGRVPVENGMKPTPMNEVLLVPFFLSKYETTVAQWKRISPDWTGSFYAVEPPLIPASGLSWDDCAASLEKAGLFLRLPTEAQWEYACRAGTTTPWWTGASEETLRGAANIDWSPNGRDWVDLQPIGGLRVNPFGLHDMTGNVGEWCRDTSGRWPFASTERLGDGERQSPGPSTPVGRVNAPNSRANRVYRGGNIASTATEVRSGETGNSPADERNHVLGLRVARPVAP